MTRLSTWLRGLGLPRASWVVIILSGMGDSLIEARILLGQVSGGPGLVAILLIIICGATLATLLKIWGER